MDETDTPQTPAELLVILAAIADEQIPDPEHRTQIHRPVQQRAWITSGIPNSSSGNSASDIAVIAHAVSAYGLPDNLKLSIHSGSDKFSIYAAIRRTLRDTGAGVHVKTAGTTWLEELIGLAEAGGEGLAWPKKFTLRPTRIEMNCVRPTPR